MVQIEIITANSHYWSGIYLEIEVLTNCNTFTSITLNLN